MQHQTYNIRLTMTNDEKPLKPHFLDWTLLLTFAKLSRKHLNEYDATTGLQQLLQDNRR
jgi:hypothetical protein